MRFEIKNRWTQEVKFTAEIDCTGNTPLRLKLGLAVQWALSHAANLTRADLTDANLTRADLTDADLTYADLTRANLTYADLTRANLTRANLTRADLTDANLTDANLTYADLTRANLTYAKNMRLPTGEMFSEYLTSTLPALLTAGGQPLGTFREHWDCHDWDNCPMAHAFSVKSEDETPLLLRPRVNQFVQLFDAGQIPWEAVQAAIDAKAITPEAK